MLTLIIVLSLVGTLALIFEVFLPGGILGIAGGVSIAAAVALTMLSPSLGDLSIAGRLAISAAIIVVSATAFALTLKYFDRTRIGKLITLQSATTATVGLPEADIQIGATATAATDLAPLGKISTGEKTLEALSESGYIASGSNLRVTRIESGTIYVVKT